MDTEIRTRVALDRRREQLDAIAREHWLAGHLRDVKGLRMHILPADGGPIRVVGGLHSSTAGRGSLAQRCACGVGRCLIRLGTWLLQLGRDTESMSMVPGGSSQA